MRVDQNIFQNSDFKSIYNSVYNTQNLKIGTLELNLRCNLSCIFCSREAHVFKKSENLILPEILSFIEDKDVVVFCGGEVLLDSRLPYLLEYCKKRGKKTSLISNGIPFSDSKICKDTLENLDFLTLSITSSDPKIYNFMTGSDQFSLFQKGLENIMKDPHEKNLYKSINIVLLNSNIKYLQDIPLFFEGLGMHSVFLYSLLYPVYLGRLLDFPQEYPDPTSEIFQKNLINLCNFLKLKNKIIRFENMSSCFIPKIVADFVDSEENYGKHSFYIKKINNKLISYTRDSIVGTYKKSPQCEFCLKKNYCKGLPEVAKILFENKITPFKENNEENKCII